MVKKRRKEAKEMPEWPKAPKKGAVGSTEIRAASISGFQLSGPLVGLLPQSRPPLDPSLFPTTQRLQHQQQDSDVAHIVNCQNQTHICGEAACLQEDYTSRCICPHDMSPPTADLKCPNRIIVPLTPRSIPNIIPPSMNVTNSTTSSPELEQMEAVETRLPEVTVLVLGSAFILTFIIALIMYYFRRRNFKTKSTSGRDVEATPMSLKESLLLANKYAPNPQYFTCSSPDVLVLQRNSLVFLKDIGEGCFGKVFKGELTLGDRTEVVAIKVLKASANKEVEEDFMREVETMSTFRHENILSLLGVVARDESNGPWMIFEYMPYGDLNEVLRANTPNLREPMPGLQPLTKDSLLWITMQIASGMEYLASQHFVHRDLACRNCLVGNDLVVKIADFGMSRDVYTCDYYRVIGGTRMLPIRWMSPESVVYGRFTLESDIYSFGVLLWEVYTFGKQPYFGHSNEEAIQLIMDGIQLIPPDDAPAFICQLMRDCWREARERPPFPEILKRLQMADKIDASNTRISTLPRPPDGLVTIRTPDALDPDGYLIPSPVAIAHEYMETVAV